MSNTSTDTEPIHNEFRWYEGLAICLSMIGVQLCSEVINQWGLYFYSPSGGVGRMVYVSIGLVGYIFIIGTFWDAFSSPVVGALSDKTPTRPGRWRIIPIYGRRRPYIFSGALLMIFTMIGFWYPPINHTSIINFIYGTVLLCAHWTLFSVAVIPLNALGPEIARSESARVALGTWTAIGMIVGLAMANALPGILISKLDPARVENHLEIITENQTHSDTTEQEIRTWLISWEIPENDLGNQLSSCLIKNDSTDRRNQNLYSLQGVLFEQLQGKSIQKAVDTILKKSEISSYQRLPRKAFLAIQVSSNNPPEAVLNRMHKEICSFLLPHISQFIEASLEAENYKIYIHTELLEPIKSADLKTPSLQNKDISLQGESLIITDEKPISELDYETIKAEVLKLCVQKNVLCSDTGIENTCTIIISKALANNLAIAEIQNSIAGSIIKNTHWISESYSPTGYRRVATVFAIISFILFMLPVICIRERYDSTAVQSEPLPWGQGLKDALRNKPFMIYAWSFFLFTIGFLAVQRVLPYWAELGLDGDESTITFLLIPFILVAIVSYAVIPIAAKYMHMKWLMFIALGIIASGMPFLYLIGKLNVDFTVRTILGMVLFGYCGIGQAIIYVMMIPMLGDIIDYDEQFSGERREAVYNGLSAFIWKASMAGSIWLASQSMSYWGNSIQQYTGVLLVGPFAGLFGLLGMILISFYPSHWRNTK